MSGIFAVMFTIIRAIFDIIDIYIFNFIVHVEIMIATITKLFSWLSAIAGVAVVVVVILLLPLSIPMVTRGFAIKAMTYMSLLFGILLWVLGLDLTSSIWGYYGVCIGTLLFIVGIIPVAMVATLCHGDWLLLGELVLLGAATYGCWWFAEKMENTLPERL